MRHRVWDRALRLSARYPKCSVVLLGSGVALGHAPLSLWPISIACLILFFSLSRDAASPMKLGWMLGFGYFLVTMNWIVEPFLVDPRAIGPVNYKGGLVHQSAKSQKSHPACPPRGAGVQCGDLHNSEWCGSRFLAR